jgi:hypothetical protein
MKKIATSTIIAIAMSAFASVAVAAAPAVKSEVTGEAVTDFFGGTVTSTDFSDAAAAPAKTASVPSKAQAETPKVRTPADMVVKSEVTGETVTDFFGNPVKTEL